MANKVENKSTTELMKLLGKKREELRSLRFGLSGSAKGAPNHSVIRREIAQIMTELKKQTN